MQNVFDVYSEKYDRWYEKNKFAYLSEIEALRKVVPKKGRGLEIGVGTGRFAGVFGVSVGIDPSESMLQIARKRKINTITAVGENLPFGNNEFDFVLMVITLAFLKDANQVITESGRVLKNNGKLIIGFVDRESELGKSYKIRKGKKKKFYAQANFYSPEEVIELLKKHDFGNFAVFQTLFQPLEKIERIEKTKKGFGEGAFVVISGRKNKVLS